MEFKRKKKTEKIYWITINKKTTELLNPNLTIEYKETKVTYYGCGPAANAIFTIKNNSSLEVLYKTEVVDISTNKKTTFYIEEWKETLNVGHGMCSGAFTFKQKSKYKVRFTPMNTDGKPLKTTTWITFNSPFMNG